MNEEEARFYVGLVILDLRPETAQEVLRLLGRNPDMDITDALRKVFPDLQVNERYLKILKLLGRRPAVCYKRVLHRQVWQESKNFALITSHGDETRHSIESRYLTGFPADHWILSVWLILQELDEDTKYCLYAQVIAPGETTFA